MLRFMDLIAKELDMDRYEFAKKSPFYMKRNKKVIKFFVDNCDMKAKSKNGNLVLIFNGIGVVTLWRGKLVCKDEEYWKILDKVYSYEYKGGLL